LLAVSVKIEAEVGERVVMLNVDYFEVWYRVKLEFGYTEKEVKAALI
jgi:hypothetical protein